MLDFSFQLDASTLRVKTLREKNLLFGSFCLVPIRIIISCVLFSNMFLSSRRVICLFSALGVSSLQRGAAVSPPHTYVSNYLFLFEANIFEGKLAFSRRTLLPFSNTFSRCPQAELPLTAFTRYK